MRVDEEKPTVGAGLLVDESTGRQVDGKVDGKVVESSRRRVVKETPTIGAGLLVDTSTGRLVD